MCNHPNIIKRDDNGLVQCMTCGQIFIELVGSALLPFAAERLYEACEAAIKNGYIGSRSEIADAALDYRQMMEEG